MSLRTYLTEIAAAIREKKGTTAQIPAAEYADEIKKLNTVEIQSGSQGTFYEPDGTGHKVTDIEEELKESGGTPKQVFVIPAEPLPSKTMSNRNGLYILDTEMVLRKYTKNGILDREYTEIKYVRDVVLYDSGFYVVKTTNKNDDLKLAKLAKVKDDGVVIWEKTFAELVNVDWHVSQYHLACDKRNDLYYSCDRVGDGIYKLSGTTGLPIFHTGQTLGFFGFQYNRKADFLKAICHDNNINNQICIVESNGNIEQTPVGNMSPYDFINCVDSKKNIYYMRKLSPTGNLFYRKRNDDGTWVDIQQVSVSKEYDSPRNLMSFDDDAIYFIQNDMLQKYTTHYKKDQVEFNPPKKVWTVSGYLYLTIDEDGDLYVVTDWASKPNIIKYINTSTKIQKAVFK